jgi:uncharacterized protein YkwD
MWRQANGAPRNAPSVSRGRTFLHNAIAGLVITASTFVALGAAPAALADSPNPPLMDQVVALTNQQRAAAGLGQLSVNPSLTQAAQSYADLMTSTGCFAHTCGPQPDFTQRILTAGYSSNWTNLGENLAEGFGSNAQAVVDGWMKSPEHRANILNPGFSEIGVGIDLPGGSSEAFWAQEFGAAS